MKTAHLIRVGAEAPHARSAGSTSDRVPEPRVCRYCTATHQYDLIRLNGTEQAHRPCFDLADRIAEAVEVQFGGVYFGRELDDGDAVAAADVLPRAA